MLTEKNIKKIDLKDNLRVVRLKIYVLYINICYTIDFIYIYPNNTNKYIVIYH